VSRGRFITLEGVEGVGKTTHTAFIAQFLSDRGIPFIETREPGGTPLAERIRDLVLQPEDEAECEKPCDDAELLLVFAARAQHVYRVIRPALEAGIWVLCSRFTDSTYAYQGGGRGIPLGRIQRLADFVHADTQPDLTLLFDLEVSIGLARAKKRGTLDRIEREQQAFFERVRNTYLTLAQQQPRFKLINASQDLAGVQRQVEAVLKAYLYMLRIIN
jgi:dTMP kinase